LPSPAGKSTEPGSTVGGSQKEHEKKASSSSEYQVQSQNEGAGETDSVELQIRSDIKYDITCEISLSGLVTALIQSGNGSGTPEDLYINHLRIQSRKSDGVWFASVATAFGTSSQTILWNYKIPDDICSFSRKESIPCGVLVLLGIVDESETPEWATKYNDYGASLDTFALRGR
jgi:hypothetical protein